MSLNQDTKNKIADLIKSDDVVLFMKGTRDAPRCGFSVAVVEILDELVPAYRTVDVLADPEIREGIKEFSDWPTIPQLYVKGEFLGGADVAKEMFASGELQRMIGVKAAIAGTDDATRSASTVSVTVTTAAAKVLREAAQAEPEGARCLRLAVTSTFKHQIGFDAKKPGDAVASSEGIEIVVDAMSAARANGVRIDAVPQADGGVAFRIENPNEPPRVKEIGPKELKQRLDDAKKSGAHIELFDARNEGERAIAKIEGAVLLDDAAREHLESLSKDTPIYFHCHHGGRSRRAAETYLAKGFKHVFNLEGGVDAWSIEVDPGVARY